MRLLIATGIYPPDIGGPATYSKILADELSKKGIHGEILSFGSVRHLPKIIRHFAYFLNCLRHGRHVDVIYAQDPVSVGFPAVLAAKILGKKFILKIVGDYAWEQQQQKNSEFITPEDFQKNKFDWITELRRKIQKFTANGAEKIIVPSEYLKKIILAWGVEESKIEVINNTFEAPSVLENREDLRRDLDFSGKVLISVGRLVPWKGFKVLIEAVSELVKKDPEIKLLIIGDGPERSNLKLKIENLKLENSIFLLGQLPHDEVISFLVAADAFILNTGYEGFSHMLLEAMATNTPIITTNVGGNPELIENNKTGILVEYNNKEEIKKAIVSILNDKVMAEKLTKNSKEKISEFGKEKMLTELISYLNK